MGVEGFDAGVSGEFLLLAEGWRRIVVVVVIVGKGVGEGEEERDGGEGWGEHWCWWS